MARKISHTRWKPIIVKKDGISLPPWIGYVSGIFAGILLAFNIYFGWKRYFTADEHEKIIPADQVIALLLESGEKKIDPNLPRPTYAVLSDISNYREDGQRAYQLVIYLLGESFQRRIIAKDGSNLDARGGKGGDEKGGAEKGGDRIEGNAAGIDGKVAKMDGIVDEVALEKVVVKPATPLIFVDKVDVSLEQKLAVGQYFFDWARKQFSTYVQRGGEMNINPHKGN